MKKWKENYEANKQRRKDEAEERAEQARIAYKAHRERLEKLVNTKRLPPDKEAIKKAIALANEVHAKPKNYNPNTSNYGRSKMF